MQQKLILGSWLCRDSPDRAVLFLFVVEPHYEVKQGVTLGHALPLKSLTR